MSQFTVTHNRVSTVSDSTANPERVQASDWNEPHDIVVSTLSVLPQRFQTDAISGYLPIASSGIIPLLINSPLAGTIDLTTVLGSIGSGSAYFTINGTSIGGTAHTVSTAENAQTHSTGNSFSTGDDLAMVLGTGTTVAGFAFSIAFRYGLTSSTSTA
jgi:hypothetical protein